MDPTNPTAPPTPPGGLMGTLSGALGRVSPMMGAAMGGDRDAMRSAMNVKKGGPQQPPAMSGAVPTMPPGSAPYTPVDQAGRGALLQAMIARGRGR